MGLSCQEEGACGADILPAPTGLACSVTSSSIVFSWNSVAGASGYTAKVQLARPGSPQTVVTTTSTSVTFTTLNSGTRHFLGVHANKNNKAQNWAGVYCTTLTAVPTFTCTSTANSITASWSAVSGATRYRSTRGTAWATTTATSRLFTGLSASTSYTIKVQSGNADGWSGTATKSCTAAASSVACRAVTDNSVELNWQAISGTTWWHAARATSGNRYTDGKILASSARSTTFTGLSANTAYTFYLWRWSGGWFTGRWTAVTPHATCTAAPAAPVVTCTATADSITATWSAVTGATRYRASRNSTSAITTATSHTFTDLAPTTSYTITVQSGSATGWGGTATKTCATTIDCAATPTTITATWSPVTGATRYQTTRNTTWTTVTKTSHTFTGLTASTSYTIKVQSGTASAWGTTITRTCTTPPAAPTPITCSVTATTVRLVWTKPATQPIGTAAATSAAAATAIRYRITSRDTSKITTATSHTLTGLAPSTAYAVSVQAGNATHWGGIAKTSCTTTPPAKPAVTCTATPNTITASWPQVEGANKYQYRFYQSSTNKGTWTSVIGNKNQYSRPFAGLKESESRTVQVQSGHDNLWGGTTTKTCEAAASIAPPTITNQPTCSSGTITITWNEVKDANNSGDNKKNAKAYEVEIGPAPNSRALPKRATFTAGTTASQTGSVTSIPDGNNQPIQMRTKNKNNKWGIWSTSTKTISCQTLAPNGVYHVTKGAYDGILKSAQKAIDGAPTACVSESNTNRLTRNRLAAIMLSIPVWEGASGTKNKAVSPMILSRYDKNIKLYSNHTRTGYVRAFWNPGVGLWQLDHFTDEALAMSHAQRANTTEGGYEVAKALRDEYCEDRASLIDLAVFLYDQWHGCKGILGLKREERQRKKDNNKCLPEYNNLYKDFSETPKDTLNVRVIGNANEENSKSKSMAWDQVDGGVLLRECRWEGEKPFHCHLYDMDLSQGLVIDHDPDTTKGSGLSPLAGAFLSFRDNNTKFAVWPAKWPASTGLMNWPESDISDVGENAKTLFMAIPEKTWSRDLNINEDNPNKVTPNIDESTKLPVAGRDGLKIQGWFDNEIVYDNQQNKKKLKVKTCTGTPFDILNIVCEWANINPINS